MEWKSSGGRYDPWQLDYIPQQSSRRPAGLPLPAACRWARWLPGLVVPREGRERKGRAGHSGWPSGQAGCGAMDKLKRVLSGRDAEEPSGLAEVALPPRCRVGGPGRPSRVCSARWRSSRPREGAGGMGGRSRVGSAGAASAGPGAAAWPASRGTLGRVPEQDTARQRLRGSFRAR